MIDTSLESQLIDNYQEMFLPVYLGEENVIHLPEENSEKPIALVFEDGQVLLIWLTEDIAPLWIKSLENA